MGRWKSDKQAPHDRGRCVDSFKILAHNAGWNNNKYIFLIAFLLFRATNPLSLEISRNKSNFRTIWGWNRQKI